MTRLLILVPTSGELHHLQRTLEQAVRDTGGMFAVCGFGLVASGIRTAQLLAKDTPDKVILVGIAGSYRSKAVIGTAETYSEIGCYGLGAGSGSDFQTAAELGWSQFTDPLTGISIHDTIELVPERRDGTRGAQTERISDNSLLLTVSASSADADDVADRLRKFPDAVAEDMEAFSVAMACQLAGIPLTVIRGISNIAGDRNKANWKVNAALNAAAELTLSRITE